MDEKLTEDKQVAEHGFQFYELLAWMIWPFVLIIGIHIAAVNGWLTH